MKLSALAVVLEWEFSALEVISVISERRVLKAVAVVFVREFCTLVVVFVREFSALVEVLCGS